MAQERSFTGAATRLGISQPSVSEMIKRLESQVGQPLFKRGARRIELTVAGEALLGPALELAMASDHAHHIALRLRRQANGILKLGAPYYTANVAERNRLIGQFVSEHQRFSLDILHDWNQNLVSKVQTGEIDMAFVQMPHLPPGLRQCLIHRSYSHYLVPQEHPLAGAESLHHADLAGHSVLTLAPSVDSWLYEWLYAPLEAHDAILIPSPEAHPDTMEQFARLRRLILLRFGRNSSERGIEGDMVRIPATPTAQIRSDIYIIRRDERGPDVAERFWKLAQKYEISQSAGG
ncbi:MAG TPA: LysR family transcriptional regulator [Paracoccus sp.]|nr:LysR family transcriptional regulator [Paracoccus sp. (in: a-proteobacteria)]